MDYPIKEEIKGLLIRLWFAGLVCYLILWGTNSSKDYLDLILFLSIAHLASDLIFSNNIIKGMFKTRLQLMKPYKEMKSFQRIKMWLYSYVENVICVLGVIGIYQLINIIIIKARNLESTAVPLPVEPILYSIIYMIIYCPLYFIKFKFVLRFLQGGEKTNDI